MESKVVLVTGGKHFLGAAVVKVLEQRPWCSEVVAVELEEYDLCEKVATQAMYARFKPHIVVHLGSLSFGVGATKERSAELMYGNLLMGVHTLHEAWHAHVEKFVALGTVCAYPEHTPVPFQEEYLWNGYPNPATAFDALAKKSLLTQIQAYRGQYGFNGVYLIPTNIYGPGDDFDPGTSHVIPAMIRKFEAAKKGGGSHVVLWGDGSATRDFLYIDDTAEGIVQAVEQYNFSDPVNLGSGQEVSVRELAEIVSKEVGFSGEIRWDSSKPSGQQRRCLDTTKAKECFGFTAKTSLQEGIKRTIEWFRALRLRSG